jgi:AcrR family transcriptional regulator
MARKSAEERRDEITEIALRQFAEGGYHGTSTEAIARDAGISQPYLFRLFRTKRELFLACVDRCYANVEAIFTEAVAAEAERSPLEAMGEAYETQMLPNRHALLFQMQGYATSEPEIRAHVRAGFKNLVRNVAGMAGVTPAETWDFFAYGMLLNVTAAIDLPREAWE